VALADAEERAKEEASRVADWLDRPESGDLHPREDERLTAMMNRCDALGTARWIVEERDLPNTVAKTITLQVLKELEEASQHFERYRREVGLKD
jgi:hypothetical protein